MRYLIKGILCVFAALQLWGCDPRVGIGVGDPWIRPTIATGSTAGYMVLESDMPDTLISASAEWCERVELHRSQQQQGGVWSMEEIEGGLPFAKGTILLSPGGYHVMFLNCTKPVKLGEYRTFFLRFSSGTLLEVRAQAKIATERR